MDYKAVASALRLPDRVLIDGDWRSAASGNTFATSNPLNGTVLAQVPACGAADVDAAVASARKAFEAGLWSQLHPSERKAVLVKLADLINQNVIELATLHGRVAIGRMDDAACPLHAWPMRGGNC